MQLWGKRIASRGRSMADIIYLSVAVASFGLLVLAVFFCARL
jgi:hypothetical protein